MGVIPPSPTSLSPNLGPSSPTSPTARKRHSLGLDEVFKNLKPLPPPSSQSGFVGFRDGTETNGKGKKKNKKNVKSIESDDDDKDESISDLKNKLASRKSTGGELTEEEKRIEEGIRKMKVRNRKFQFTKGQIFCHPLCFLCYQTKEKSL